MVTYSSKKKQMADNGGAEEKRSHKVSLGVRDRTERGGWKGDRDENVQLLYRRCNFFIDDMINLLVLPACSLRAEDSSSLCSGWRRLVLSPKVSINLIFRSRP